MLDGYISAFPRTRIKKLPAIELVPYEVLRFQSPQHRANRGIRQRPVFADRGAHVIARRGTMLPKKLHNLLFEGAESFLLWHSFLHVLMWRINVTECNVTNC